MAVLSRWKREPTPKAVMAAAVPLSGPNAIVVGRGLKPGTEDWQKEAWYHYDACGEFRSAVTWIANAVSKADIYAAETDPETGTLTGPTDDPRVQAAAATALGGMTRRAQMLKTLALHWQVPGESFVVVRPVPAKAGVPQPDEWLAVSGTKVVYKAGSWQYTDPATMTLVTLRPGQDRLIRVWSPHPNDGSKADSAARPALPILREIEKSSQHIAGNLDSRLGTAGVWPIPAELDFPRAEGQSLGEAVGEMLLAAAEASLTNPGTAAARVPLVFPVPGEQIPNLSTSLIDFATEFTAGVSDLRTAAIGRLAQTLDMPNETAEGSTGGMNHWGAWQVEESTYKIFIEPLLDAIGDAVTHEWFWDVLRAMGVTDPERFILAWETSGIVSRPDRTQDLKQLWDDALISDDYRRAEMGIPDDAVPTEDEVQLRRLERVVVGAPTLAADPQIGQRLFGFEVAPAAAGVAPEAADVSAGGDTPALPSAPSEPAQPSADDVPEGLVASAELIVYDALSRAGGRLLTRQFRGQFASTPKHELHTVIPTEGKHGPLLQDSFQFVDRVAEAYGLRKQALSDCLYAYCAVLIDEGAAHDRVELTERLALLR